MNILLLEDRVESLKLPIRDEVASHIISVLRAKTGDSIDVGVKNGPKGKATLIETSEKHILLAIKWNEIHANDLYPVFLLVGLSRPQTCRKILEQASSMGVAKMHFCSCEKGEVSYRQSRLWTTEEWQAKILRGVEQSFSTFVPECKIWNNLETGLQNLKEGETELHWIIMRVQKFYPTCRKIKKIFRF